MLIVKSQTYLGKKVQAYLRWKHSDKRYVACATVHPSGMIKVLTINTVDSEDYYHEWISPYIMNLEIKENKLI